VRGLQQALAGAREAQHSRWATSGLGARFRGAHGAHCPGGALSRRARWRALSRWTLLRAFVTRLRSVCVLTRPAGALRRASASPPHAGQPRQFRSKKMMSAAVTADPLDALPSSALHSHAALAVTLALALSTLLLRRPGSEEHLQHRRRRHQRRSTAASSDSAAHAASVAIDPCAVELLAEARGARSLQAVSQPDCRHTCADRVPHPAAQSMRSVCCVLGPGARRWRSCRARGSCRKPRR
jgi:hypothetical protein